MHYIYTIRHIPFYIKYDLRYRMLLHSRVNFVVHVATAPVTEIHIAFSTSEMRKMLKWGLSPTVETKVFQCGLCSISLGCGFFNPLARKKATNRSDRTVAKVFFNIMGCENVCSKCNWVHEIRIRHVYRFFFNLLWVIWDKMWLTLRRTGKFFLTFEYRYLYLPTITKDVTIGVVPFSCERDTHFAFLSSKSPTPPPAPYDSPLQSESLWEKSNMT